MLPMGFRSLRLLAVGPIDPFKGGKLERLEASPWSAPVDHLGLVETVDGFGESIA
jgi:hypothetical protein